jgi:hypothetical protein
MKSLKLFLKPLFLFALIFALFSLVPKFGLHVMTSSVHSAYAQSAASPSGAPVAVGAPAVSAAPSLFGLGFSGTIILVIALFNVALSAASQVFAALHKQEPGWLQTLGTIGLGISQYVTGNTSTPALSQPGPAKS